MHCLGTALAHTLCKHTPQPMHIATYVSDCNYQEYTNSRLMSE